MLDAGDVLVASVTFAGFFVLLRWMKQNGTKDAGKRYPPSLSTLEMFRSMLGGGIGVLPEYLMRCADKLGPIFSINAAGRTIVVLSDYETIFSAMVRQSETFADRGSFWIEDKVINHERRGIIFVPYDERFKKNHRLVLTILKEFGFGSERVMETRIQQEVENLTVELAKLEGRSFNPKWTFTFSTSNVLVSILFGRTFLQSFPKEHSTIIENSRECLFNMDLTLNMAPVVRFLPSFRRKVDRLRTTCQNLLNSIEEGIKFVKSTEPEATFIGKYLAVEGTDYDHQTLLFVLRDLCFGSTETVPSTLEWAMVELANHPEVQYRFQKEIDEMVPGDRLPSLDDKPRLPYTEAVILEVMRRRTVVPFLIPHSPLKDTKLLGYDIPQGCIVMPNVYSVHMDPKTWENPECFRPERFLDKENKLNNKVISFGLGKRSCTGEILGRQSVFLFLTSLVQRFHIRPPEGQDKINAEEITAITMTSSNFEVRLIPRIKVTQC